MFEQYFARHDHTAIAHAGFHCRLARVARGLGLRANRGFGFSVEAERPPGLFVIFPELRVKRFFETTQSNELFDLEGILDSSVRLTANLDRDVMRGPAEWQDVLSVEMAESNEVMLEEAAARDLEIEGLSMQPAELWPHGPVRCWSTPASASTPSREFIDSWLGVADARVELLASFPRGKTPREVRSWLAALTVITH